MIHLLVFLVAGLLCWIADWRTVGEYGRALQQGARLAAPLPNFLLGALLETFF